MGNPKKLNMASIGKGFRDVGPIKENIQSALPNETHEEGRGVGRPKKTSIKRVNGKTVYFDDDAKLAIKNIHFNNRIENTQRIVQTALWQFLQAYYHDNQLNEEGMKLIEEYEKMIVVD